MMCAFNYLEMCHKWHITTCLGLFFVPLVVVGWLYGITSKMADGSSGITTGIQAGVNELKVKNRTVSAMSGHIYHHKCPMDNFGLVTKL